jgi:hypothetical protein
MISRSARVLRCFGAAIRLASSRSNGGCPPCAAGIGQRLQQIGAEELEVDYLGEVVELIPEIAQPLQPIINTERTSLTGHHPNLRLVAVANQISAQSDRVDRNVRLLTAPDGPATVAVDLPGARLKPAGRSAAATQCCLLVLGQAEAAGLNDRDINDLSAHQPHQRNPSASPSQPSSFRRSELWHAS